MEHLLRSGEHSSWLGVVASGAASQMVVQIHLVGRGLVRRERGSIPRDSVRGGNSRSVTLVRQTTRAARPLNAQPECCRGALLMPNVDGNRLARQGQSELTGLLGLGAEAKERNA